MLEDDGLREAEQGHRVLVAELRRILALWLHRWLETASPYGDNDNLLKTMLCETFVDMSSMAKALKIASSMPVRSNTTHNAHAEGRREEQHKQSNQKLGWNWHGASESGGARGDQGPYQNDVVVPVCAANERRHIRPSAEGERHVAYGGVGGCLCFRRTASGTSRTRSVTTVVVGRINRNCSRNRVRKRNNSPRWNLC